MKTTMKFEPLIPVSRPTVAKDFIAAIWQRWLASVQNILEVGQLLIRAKEKLQHGEFLEMVRGALPFGEDKAERLMAIARNPVLSNSDYSRNLPPSWQTLYELSRVPEDTLSRAITDGRVNPELMLHQAQRLWRGLPDRVLEYAIFHCPGCKAQKLRIRDSRPSALGELDDRQPRLYVCDGCNLPVLTSEEVIGPYTKKSLEKNSASGAR